jgi:hypothetical protein
VVTMFMDEAAFYANVCKLFPDFSGK